MLCTPRVGPSFAHSFPYCSSALRLIVWAFALAVCFGIPGIAWSDSFDLQWDPVTDDPRVTGYQVHARPENGQYAQIAVADTEGADTSTATVQLAAAGTYYLAVRSHNDDNTLTSSFSNEVPVTVGSSDTTPPTVSLTTTPAGPTYTSTRSVTVDANATDNVGVSRVDFYDGATLMGTDTTLPYRYAWTIGSADNGGHGWTARAYDSAGNVTTSSVLNRTVNISTPPDTTPPTVSLSTAPAGPTYTSAQTVSVNANASDNLGVSRVEFYDGTTLMGTDTSSPYSYTWSISNADNGSHSWTARAYDAAGNATTSSVLSRTVEIALSGASVTLQWDPVTDDPLVTGYEVHHGLASGQYQWATEADTNGAATNTKTVENLVAGNTYYFAVRSCNHNPDTVSAFSNEVSVTVGSPDTTPPTVSLATAPAGPTYTGPQTVTLTANASDNAGVTRVEFRRGATLMGTDTVAPYSHAWLIGSADNGTHSWTATAYDAAGNAATSSALSRTVAIDLLTVDFTADSTDVLTRAPVSFNGSASGEVTEWSWDFGDGGTSTSQTALYTYNTAGTYTVRLTVSGPGGSDTEIKTDYIRVSAPLVADFSTSATSGGSPLTVAFTDTSTGDIRSYEWDFGDGGTSSESNPDYTYVVPGTYDVTLTVTGPGGSDTITRVDHVHVYADEVFLEAGEITVDHEWRRVDFEHAFSDPIVIVGSPSGNGDDPAVVRVDAVDSEGFWVRVQEWDYLDDWHTEETVSYLVVESGRHQLPNGAWIEANWYEVGDAVVVAQFEEPFAITPVVLTTVITNNEGDAVTTRVRNINEYDFEMKLQEQEANIQDHAPEAIAYIAWEPSVGEVDGMLYEVGRTGDEVKHRVHTIGFLTAFDLPPMFLADMQTTDGRDTANVRWTNKGAESADVWVDEEGSRNSETRHTTEIAGYIAIETAAAHLGGLLAQDATEAATAENAGTQ